MDVNCPAAKPYALGGGGEIAGVGTKKELTGTLPLFNGAPATSGQQANGWRAIPSTPAGLTTQVWVICSA
jgi:hypothetical protein